MSSRFYIGNLPPEATERTLTDRLTACGLHVERVDIVLNRSTGLSRGFGFVQIRGIGTAPAAIASLEGLAIDGRDADLQVVEETPRSGVNT